MDILTQSAMGAVMAQTVAQKQHMRKAAAIGLFAGLLADIDVLIRSSSDPLLMLEYHRHFTHSIFFVPLGALLAALIAWPFVKRHLGFRQIYVFAFMGYMLSGFIDACTSYGTHLFWPLDPGPVSWNIISIVDPLFTLILLVSLVVAVKKTSHVAVWAGLVLAASYLLFGWSQLQRATDISREMAVQRQHKPERLLLKPTLGNLILWRSVYQFQGRLYVDAVRLGLFKEHRIYPGASVQLFNVDDQFPTLAPSTVLYNDIQRFISFSDHYVALLPARPGLLVDIRYSMLPDSLEPLWGLQMDTGNPNMHAEFVVTRNTSSQIREKFMAMLQGRDVESAE